MQSAAGWLVIVVQMPLEDPAARMRVLRTLESLGAAVMREGAYLLPENPPNRQSLDTLAEYIVKCTGQAHVLQVQATSAAQVEAFKRLFDRTARYESLVKTVESLRVGFGLSDPSAISRVLHKQRREFEAIGALDFFPTEARANAERALAEADAAVKKLLFPHTPGQAGPADNLLGRIWATRKPLWADRLASAWLIRRFIDPEGKVLWLDKLQDPPAGAIGFAYDGADFANSSTRVTYEEILVQLRLADNSALVRIGSLVHFLEARGTPVPEAAGVQTLLQGAVRRARSEDELLSEAEKTFDLLYEAYFEPARRS
ncbi:MAG TPA: chromate resistance protein ChrB domain-containing protein [Burkholderiales bacterium]|nr:chromate resistance protein ChrB domain-containing protein [Burkholderiales bacterium]